MRLLLFADVHLDAPFASARPELARARRAAQREALTRIAGLADELRVDAVCCAGDLYEQERYGPDTAAFLRDCFADLHPTPVLLAPGNHDWLGPTSLYQRGDWSDNVHIFTEPRLVPFPLRDGFTVWGSAHCSPSNTPGPLDRFAVDRGGVHVALFHGSEQGDWALQEASKRPHAPFRAGQVPQAGLHHALVGHYHTPRDGEFHTYPGNPEPLTFGEAGARGAVLVDIDDAGRVTRERHRVGVFAVHDLTVPVDGAAHGHEIRQRVGDAVTGLGGLVRVTLTGEVGADVDLALGDWDDLAERHRLDALVVREGAIDVAYDWAALAAEPTVRGQFVRDVRAATDLDDDQRRRVLITGLRALAGRRLDLDVR